MAKRATATSIKLTDGEVRILDEIAARGGQTRGATIQHLIPDPASAKVLTALAGSPQGFELSYRALVWSGILARLETAQLDTRLALDIERHLRAGNMSAICEIAELVVEAQSAEAGDESARYQLVKVEGGDGRVPLPRGSKAKLIDGEVEVFPPEPASLSEAIADLRSDNPAARFEAGQLVAFMVGKGLRESGASELDAEFGAGRDVSDLIGKAIAGDTAAVDQLEALLTTDPTKAKKTPTEPGETKKPSKSN